MRVIVRIRRSATWHLLRLYRNVNRSFRAVAQDGDGNHIPNLMLLNLIQQRCCVANGFAVNGDDDVTQHRVSPLISDSAQTSLLGAAARVDALDHHSFDT